MGRQRSSPSMRKKVQRKHVMELLRITARPPQERWSIRESVNFKIALGRSVSMLKNIILSIRGHNPGEIEWGQTFP
uniref:Uncharacterized protein n=1 Tax=Aegilops tauschii TaxID=37682 RepID=M8BPW5_AEGTA